MKLSTYFLLLSIFWVALATSQEKTITGNVTSQEEGLPLPGVNVIIKGTSQGTQTDFDGNYSIKVEEGDTIIFSYIGFNSQEKIIDSETVINVILQVDISELEEVVVVGYGTQTKRRITDNIASVSSKDINLIPTASLQSTLTAKAAGVQVTQLNGKVEGGIKVRVRGVSTITSSQEPLYVIDGVPLINTDQSINRSPINPLVFLNPNDIESIEILKDASSAAIYGARGTNGVVIITTKKGKAGKTTISLNNSFGWSEATNKRDWLNAEQYVELFTESRENVGRTADGVFDFFANGEDWANGAIDTDWQDLALVKGFTQDYGISVSGGTEKTQVFFSAAYNETKGITRGNKLERFNIRANVSHNISDKINVGVNTNLSKTTIDRIANDNAFSTPLQAIAQVPLSVPYNEDGVPNSDSTLYYNFLTEEYNGSFKTNVWKGTANLFGQYYFLPELSFRSEFGYDFNNQVAERFSGSLTESASVGGFGTANAVETERYLLTNYFSYIKNIGEANTFEATFGMSFEETTTRIQFLQAQGFPSDDLQTLNSASNITNGGSSRTAFNFLSYFARATYSIHDKYLLKGSIRYDGSSRFGQDNRYGWFPAASAGWIISEENFINESEVISLLKLRASWGITGNAGIGNFASLSLIQGSPYNQKAALAPVQLGDSSLKWEKTTQYDVGLDYGFLNNRITGEIDYYVKETKDLLLSEPVPSTSGFTTITRNVGEIKNSGIEFVLNTKNIVSEKLNWSTSINISNNKNKVTKLPGGDIIRGRNIVREGETASSFYMIEYAGVNPENGDAIYYRNDILADGSLDKRTTNNPNEAQRIIVGSPYPKWLGGLTNNITYKDFDFSFTFQGQWEASLYNSAGRFQSANGDFWDNQTTDQLNRWQNSGDITNVPQARFGESNGTQHSTRYLQNADFIRLRNLSLGYTLPKIITEKLKLSRLRIYFAGFNLLTITDFDGYDPESTADFNDASNNIQVGESFYSAPPAKTFTLGFNIDF